MIAAPSELRELARRMESGDVLPAETVRRCSNCPDASSVDPSGVTDHEWRLAVDALRLAADVRERQIAQARELAEFFG